MSTETETTLTELPHWIGGAAEPSDGGRTGPVFDPALGIQTKRVAFAGKREVDAAVAAARAAFPGWRETSLARRQAILFRFRELLEARKQDLAEMITSRARQGALRRARRDQPRPGGGRVRDRHRPPHERRVRGAGLHRHRRVTRSGSRWAWSAIISPVQLPGDGAGLVLPDRDRDRQHGGAQAEREGPFGGALAGTAVAGGGAARRRVQRAERRQGGRGRSARASRRGRDLLRRLDPDRPVRVRDRDRQRQARAGAGRSQEPHAGAARRRPRPGRRRGHQRRFRLGRGALHGDQRRRRGRSGRRTS